MTPDGVISLFFSVLSKKEERLSSYALCIAVMFKMTALCCQF